MNINQHEFSDEELDHLFSDAAEKMDFDFEPDSWTKMSQKLDAVKSPVSSESQADNAWQKRWLLLLLALLLMFGGYYFTKNSTPNKAAVNLETKNQNTSENESKANDKKYVATDKVATEVLNKATNKSEILTNTEKTINASPAAIYENKINDNKQEIKTTTEANPAAFKAENKKTNKETASSIKPEKDIYTSEPIVFEHKKTDKKAVLGNLKKETGSSESSNIISQHEYSVKTSKNKGVFQEKSKQVSEKNVSSQQSLNSNYVNAEKGTTTENLVRSLNENPTKPFENSNNLSSNAIIKAVDGISPSNTIPMVLEEKTERWSLGELKKIAPKESIFKSNLFLPTLAFANPKAEPATPTKKITDFNRGLYLRLGFSPDFSYVTISETAKLGSNVAALLEYRFNKRLSVQSGVIRSMKYYNAYPASYEWPTKWGTKPYSLVDINAICKMIDIPLNVRYDLSQKSKSRLFVGAGATSYIMKKEKYTYNYEDPNSSWIKFRGWQGVQLPKQYYLSSLNFSLGYERQFFQKLSIQAEPFVKIPVKKLGFGKVNLSTIGVFITAKYPILKF